MTLKNLSRFLWPLLVILIIGIWYSVTERSTESAGRRVYLQQCANCHMEQGQGLARLIPPLANADYLKSLSVEELSCIIRYGQKDTIAVNGVTYDRPMPANDLMTEVELTALVNYLRLEWGDATEKLGHSIVINALANCDSL
ncbi:MAG: cytochrome c [Bacteroidia bacterium]